MKPRPRNVENEIADRLSIFFARYSLEKVERIPIIGRTGPDIEINEFGWVIDVKSRNSCPKKYFKEAFTIIKKSYVMFPISDLIDPLNIGASISNETKRALWLSPTVEAWHKHMYEWTEKKYYQHMHRRYKDHWDKGITSIIMHRKGMSYDSSMVFMHVSDWSEFIHRLQYYEESEEKSL